MTTRSRTLKDARDRVLEEHRVIQTASGRVERARDLFELIEALRQFRVLLEPHFSLEDAPGGFFDLVRSRAPRHGGAVEELRREHDRFLAEIDRLVEQARACLEGPVAEVLRRAADLARAQRRHETRENELLMDAMYVEGGHGD